MHAGCWESHEFSPFRGAQPFDFRVLISVPPHFAG